MKMHHTPSHWIMVALVLAALLLTLSEAHGQSGAAAVFEGRPAMAGAQGGQGAADGAVDAADADTASRKDVMPARDQGLAQDQRSARKAVRGVKRSISRARHGNSPVDAAK